MTEEAAGLRVLVVDDHPIVRHGLMQMLSADPGISRCVAAETVAEALATIERSRPDAVVLDISLGEESGLDLLRRMQARDLDVPVLVLSMFDESVYAERSLRLGARGYLMKEAAAEHVVDAVHRIARGETVLSPEMAARMDDADTRGIASLSDRELAVLTLIGSGNSVADIARLHSRSIKTIEAQRESIKRKLGLRSAAELARYAVLWVQCGGA